MTKFACTMSCPDNGPTGMMYIIWDDPLSLIGEMHRRGYSNVRVRPLHKV